MKCYVGGHVDPSEHEFVAVCFASDRRQAKNIMWAHSERLQDECDGDWMAARVVRNKKFDNMLDPEKTSSYIVNDERTLRMMGWRKEGDSLCESCGLAEMGGEFPTCRECYQCNECGHNEACKYKGEEIK